MPTIIPSLVIMPFIFQFSILRILELLTLMYSLRRLRTIKGARRSPMWDLMFDYCGRMRFAGQVEIP